LECGGMTGVQMTAGYLEGGRWQVGYGDVLQVVLQCVDERGDGQLQGVSILDHDAVIEEHRHLLHIAWTQRERSFKPPQSLNPRSSQGLLNLWHTAPITKHSGLLLRF